MPKPIEESFQDWEATAFGFGYGTGEEHILPALKGFFAQCGKDGRTGYDYQELESALGPAVAWLLINRLAQLDVLEYGTSPRFGWLTHSGESLKQFVDATSADRLIELATDRTEEAIVCYPDACNCGPRGYEAGRKCDNPFWRR